MRQQRLNRKRETILQRELAFANAIGAAVLEKPRVNFWMVLIPILFLHLIYRMQQYKSGRMKFDEDFMITRRRAMNVAFEAASAGAGPDLEAVVRDSGLPEPLQASYRAWVAALVAHYGDLLTAEGEDFDELVRAAYHNRSAYLLALDRLNTVEKEFYVALKPRLEATEGAAAIVATIESQSRKLRGELAERIFG
jgi:hypothetical protein